MGYLLLYVNKKMIINFIFRGILFGVPGSAPGHTRVSLLPLLLGRLFPLIPRIWIGKCFRHVCV